MKLSVTQKIGLALFVPAFAAFVATMVFYNYLLKTQTDAAFTNLAGKQRMLSEQMIGEVSELAVGSVDHRPMLEELRTQFDAALYLIEFGGTFNGQAVKRVDPVIYPELKKVKIVWASLQTHFNLLSELNNSQKISSQHTLLIKIKLHALQAASDEFVSKYSSYSFRMQQRMLAVLVAIVAIDIFIFLAGFWAIRQHLNEQKQTGDALIESEKDWRQTFDSISDFVSIHDKDNRILRANHSLERFMGAEPGELNGRRCSDIFHCGDESKENCPHDKSLITNQVSTIEHTELSIGFPLEVSTYPIRDEHGEITASVHVAKNTTIQKRAERELDYLAHYDQLTGLPNRTLFFKALNRNIQEASIDEAMTAVMFIDLDRFKIINDSLGHETGDQVLKLVGQRLSETVRAGDIVARLGGDEFAVILVGISIKEDILKAAKKIVDCMTEPFRIDAREFFLTTSIGISTYPEDGDNAESLLRKADISMYRAKDKGKNNFQLYSSAMGAVAPLRLALETDLQYALKQKEFEVYYQPKIHLASGEIVGMEALLRWNHPRLGQVAPGEFIFLLEETGLIVEVGEWVLRTACRQTRELQENGFPNLTVSVNVSGRQFRHQGLCHVVTRALNDSGISPEHLELELTESILVDRVDEAAKYLASLKALNVRIGLDDFGTGYSSLSYLKRFPLDTLKIDRSFVSDVTIDPDAAAIVKTVISLARDLRMSVVAEGVETKEQLSFMEKNDCDEIQGFYFSKPIPFKEFTILLSQHSPVKAAG